MINIYAVYQPLKQERPIFSQKVDNSSKCLNVCFFKGHVCYIILLGIAFQLSILALLVMCLGLREFRLSRTDDHYPWHALYSKLYFVCFFFKSSHASKNVLVQVVQCIFIGEWSNRKWGC